MNVNDIKTYWLYANEDEDEKGTYTLEIESSYGSVIFNKVKVGFVGNGSIAFPARFEILDADNNVVNVFGITAKTETPNTTSDAEVLDQH